MLEFWRNFFQSIAPKENRLIAAVAFYRTFRQGLTGSAFTAAGGGIALTAVGIAEINWTTTLYAAIAVLIAAFVSGLNAFFNVLENGLSRKYAEAVVTTIAKNENAVLESAAAITEANSTTDETASATVTQAAASLGVPPETAQINIQKEQENNG